ncbi:unnamed protein product, partial [Prorocentrum cordatum]
DAHVRRAASRALADVAAPGDSVALPALARALRDDDGEARCEARDVLEALAAGEGAELAVAEVLQLLRAEQPPRTRSAALRVLSRVGGRGSAGGGLHLVLGLLADPDDTVRWEAAKAVGKVAPLGDTGAVAALLAGASDEDEDVREGCLDALSAAGGPSAAIAAAAADALSDGAECVRAAAVRCLRGCAAAEAASIGGLVVRVLPLTESEDEGIRAVGLEALAAVSTRGESQAVAAAHACLEDSDEDVRAAAVCALAALAPLDEGRAHLSLILGRLAADGDEDVRQAAAAAVATLACAADDESVRCLLQTLRGDEDTGVRCAAAAALATVAAKGDETVLSALSECSGDAEEEVRKASLAAVVALAGQGSGTVWSIVEPLLSHAEADVRRSAVEEFASCMGVGASACSQAEALASKLEDKDGGVREAAVAALAELGAAGGPGAEQPLRATEARLTSAAAPEVRAAALEALAKMAEVGATGATLALLRGLEDRDGEVRAGAARLVGGLQAAGAQAEAARGAALAGCEALLGGGSSGARVAAVSALAGLLPPGGPAGRAVAERCLARGEPAARRSGLELLGALAGPGCAQGIRLAAAALGDQEEKVRDAAVAALKSIVKGNGNRMDIGALQGSDVLASALCLVRRWLASPSAEVRCSAVEAVAAAAPRGEDSAVSTVLPMAEDADADVRWTVMGALGALAPKGHEGAVAAIARCAKDDDEQVRIAAVDALAECAALGCGVDVEALLKERLEDSPEVARSAMRALLVLCTDKQSAAVMQAAGAAREGKSAATAA